MHTGVLFICFVHSLVHILYQMRLYCLIACATLNYLAKVQSEKRRVTQSWVQTKTKKALVPFAFAGALYLSDMLFGCFAFCFWSGRGSMTVSPSRCDPCTHSRSFLCLSSQQIQLIFKVSFAYALGPRIFERPQDHKNG